MKATSTFWNYFNINQKTISNLQNEHDKTYKLINFWLERHIKNYCHHLDYILFFPKKSGEKSQIIITANGNPLYFNYVETFVKAAPRIKNWEVKAFLQPSTKIEKIKQGLDEPYIFCDLILKTSELKFALLNPDEQKKKLDIVVYLKDYTIYCDNKILLEAVFIIVQDLLGEKSMYENLNFVQLGQMPVDDTNLIQLFELQAYIDKINSRKN
ncbi:MAG: hypothetical protein H7339_16995 [Arcicella sp.]|nr:hypothetical protein [Arcicella sp.]